MSEMPKAPGRYGASVEMRKVSGRRSLDGSLRLPAEDQRDGGTATREHARQGIGRRMDVFHEPQRLPEAPEPPSLHQENRRHDGTAIPPADAVQVNRRLPPHQTPLQPPDHP